MAASESQAACAHRVFVRPKGCGHCPHFCPRAGISACMLVHSLWFCLHYFMEFSVAGSMTLRPGSSVSSDVPGSAAMSLGIAVAGVRPGGSVQVCGIRTPLPGSPGLVDPPDFGAPSWQRCSLSLPRSTRRSGIPIRMDGTRWWGTGSGTFRRRRPYRCNCGPMTLRGPRVGRPGPCPFSGRPPFRSRSLGRRACTPEGLDWSS